MGHGKIFAADVMLGAAKGQGCRGYTRRTVYDKYYHRLNIHLYIDYNILYI